MMSTVIGEVLNARRVHERDPIPVLVVMVRGSQAVLPEGRRRGTCRREKEPEKNLL